MILADGYSKMIESGAGAANMISFLRAVREKDYLGLLYTHGLKKENVEKLKAAVTEVMP